MGKAIAALSPAARAVFERADAALGQPISTTCFEGPSEALMLTANTQPALVATSVAIVAALRERYGATMGEPPDDLILPAFAAGHSLGEYSALVVAGALDLEDAVRLCRLRGASMQEAVPPGAGAMAAIMGLSPDVVVELCAEAAQGEVVQAANFNAPGQIVIAGHTGAVARVRALVSGRAGKAVPLKVSAPFHCALMRPAAERLAPELAAVRVGRLAFPVVANVDAMPNTDPARVRELLIRQIDGPVEWVKSIERIAAEGVTHALEIGPGKVLAGLCKRIAKQVAVLNVSDAESLERVGSFLSGGERA
jgi:[acyl-carrier-protein] S-malonyltransferase